jgi:hypothetical protein
MRAFEYSKNFPDVLPPGSRLEGEGRKKRRGRGEWGEGRQGKEMDEEEKREGGQKRWWGRGRKRRREEKGRKWESEDRVCYLPV